MGRIQGRFESLDHLVVVLNVTIPGRNFFRDHSILVEVDNQGLHLDHRGGSCSGGQGCWGRGHAGAEVQEVLAVRAAALLGVGHRVDGGGDVLVGGGGGSVPLQHSHITVGAVGFDP